MLRFQLFGFPIVVHWMFWVTMAILGGAERANSPRGVQLLLGWVLAGFVSIVIHELGHAFAMRRFGAKNVNILLYGFGGLAQGNRWFSRWEDIIVSAAGPGVQIVAGFAFNLLFSSVGPSNAFLFSFAKAFYHVSIFWALLNLLPIIPLDGGHICRALLASRQRLALIISIVFAVALGVYFLQQGSMLSGLFFGMMALNNWKELQGEPQIPMGGR
ncbi:MAG: site-2 protease family protein [Verrucomicrobiota bacterium]